MPRVPWGLPARSGTEGVAQLPRVASRQTPPLDLGIGIETGQVMVGSFGPAHRRVHSVLGEAVTIAARLEGLTAELAYPILIGPEAVKQSGTTDTKALGDFLLAGMSQARKIHALPVEYDGEPLTLGLQRRARQGAVLLTPFSEPRRPPSSCAVLAAWRDRVLFLPL